MDRKAKSIIGIDIGSAFLSVVQINIHRKHIAGLFVSNTRGQSPYWGKVRQTLNKDASHLQAWQHGAVYNPYIHSQGFKPELFSVISLLRKIREL